MGRSDGEQRKVQGSQVKIKRMTHLIRQLIKPQGDWAMEPWLSFYKPHFPSQLAAEQFVEACENLEPSGANHVAKIMMHRGIMFRGFLRRFSQQEVKMPFLMALR